MTTTAAPAGTSRSWEGRDRPVFRGKVKIPIQKQEAQPRAIQAILKANLGDGSDLPNEVRFQCRIAQDTATRMSAGVTDASGNTWIKHPRVNPQFGRTPQGDAYLTVTLVQPETNERVCVRWEGDKSFPDTIKRVAVHHDLGKKVAAKTITLDWADAILRPTDNGAARTDRGTAKEYRKKNVEKQKRRGTYARLCEDDLA